MFRHGGLGFGVSHITNNRVWNLAATNQNLGYTASRSYLSCCVLAGLQGIRRYGAFPNFWVPHDKDYRILGSILGSPYFEKVLYYVKQGFRGAMRNSASVQALKLSENRGSPIQTPKYYHLYYGNP